MRYKTLNKPLAEIAQELRVDAVVEGSVLRSGGRVRISAQLVDSASDKHLWARSYERELRDVLALQSEVARAIADEIQVRLRPRADAAHHEPSRRSAAHEDYIKGRFYWNKRTEEGLKRGIQYFQQAIDLEPNYARPTTFGGLLAGAGLVWLYAVEGRFLRARAAATKALELNGSMAEAQTTLAFVSANYDSTGKPPKTAISGPSP